SSEAPQDVVLHVQGLHKRYRSGFVGLKQVHAVRGIDFSVTAGARVGLLGPNGAGKTTTLKMILGLIRPTAGQIALFGAPHRTRRVRRRLGYMPENPYLYQYLRPMELLALCGRLLDMPKARWRSRACMLLEAVGLQHAAQRRIGGFSKGMMQRIALAQALLNEPELLVLDEPLSGLDPLGRKMVRDLLLAEQAAGRTLLMTSHILSDIEVLCDSVVILRQGQVVARGPLDELLRPEERITEVHLAQRPHGWQAAWGSMVHEAPGKVVLHVDGQEALHALLGCCHRERLDVLRLTPHRDGLEELFLRTALGEAASQRVPTEHRS
ncbi:MAG: ABC transporter ATP-binding protein, partial [Polyangiales bacterium]